MEKEERPHRPWQDEYRSTQEVKSLMKDLFQHILGSFLRVSEQVVDSLESGVDYQELQQRLKKELDRLGVDVLKSVIESADEQLRLNASERPGWVVAQRNHEKELLTPFGPMRYQRTYFKHKSRKRHAYLVDEAMGFTPHQRIDVALKAELVEKATEQSFRRSGQWSEDPSWRVSGQTVMKASRTLHTDVKPLRGGSKKRLPYLFIQADEDHVPNQDGPHWEPRLVTVHEGVEGSPQRRRLVNPKRFGGLYNRGSLEQLYEQVWQYLDKAYDLEHVKGILVSGDGAGWIRGLCEYIPGSVFLLDRFHARKYILAATGSDTELYGQLWQALRHADRSAMRKAISEAMKRSETEPQLRRIMDCKRYFERQWDGIRAWQTYGDIWPGCSAEGDVSHIYAARMSSRPMAWGRKGIDQMSRMRIMRSNGCSVRQTYLDQHRDRLSPVRVARTYLNEARQTFGQQRDLSHVLQGHMPALHGSERWIRRVLTSILNK